MILCNFEIQRAIDEGRLVIDPEPLPRRPEPGKDCPYDTHSVDLSLGDEISTLNEGIFSIDFTRPGKFNEFMARNSTTVRISNNQPYSLKPHQFILGLTRQVVKLPIVEQLDTCLAARIEGKSSRARCGLLIHFTAPTVHPGFDGTLTLEMINLGNVPILLYPGMAIAQLIVEEVRGVPFRKDSQFQGQRKPAG